ncbi:hypothetical protein ACFWDQ_38550 [Streptomyces sp. NPDC060053]|uniref:hypothetical protein n=1 Tax=Streptomyces sp. NPDC060053 TaxID=3347047 RepID=UPI00369B465D
MGVERWVGCEGDVLPSLPPVLVPESSASLADGPLDELGVDELSWSWLELPQPPPPPL